MFRFFTYLLLTTMLLSSCDEMSQDELQYNVEIYQTLLRDNEQLRQKVEELKYDFEDKLHDDIFASRIRFFKLHFDNAIIGYDSIFLIADSIRESITADINLKNYENGNKYDIKKVINNTYNYDKDVINNIETSIKQIENKQLNLEEKISQRWLQDTLLQPILKDNIIKDISNILKTPHSTVTNKQKYLIKEINRLLSIENNILYRQNNILEYYNNQFCILRLDYTIFSAIATINSEVLFPNQAIEVYAGMGSFSDESKPNISINHQKINLIDGMATYKTKAPSKKGKYSFPVVFEYINPDGSKSKMIKEMKYTVIDTICK